jgi:hypothetical protein
MSGDWFVQYGLISIERLEGDAARATDLCEKVLGRAEHKAALFNCGLVEFQNKKAYAKAKELFNKSAKARGGETAWDTLAVDMLTEVDIQEAEAKQIAARSKQQQQQAGKTEAGKPKPVQPTQGKPQ